MRRIFHIAIILFLGVACREKFHEITSVEERVATAKGNLKDLLTAPANGWKVNYQPEEGSGTFYMILDFDENGTVKISSDLPADSGVYYNEVIPYRIDAGQAIELIFETYGVFHYLFELDQASFGAEFEFLFVEEDGGSLTFESKTDATNPSKIIFEEASSADLNAFSREIAENFQAYTGQSPKLFGGVNPTQHLHLSNIDYSVLWSIDLQKRTVTFDVAGNGATIDEVLSGNYVSISQSSGFTFLNGKIIFDSPVQLNAGNGSLTLSEVTLNDFSETGPSICPGSGVPTPVYSVSVGGNSGTLGKNLFNSSGLGFEPKSSSFYSVNIPYVLDDSLRSLSEDGSIAQLLPDASGFVVTYGLEADSIPANSVGFIVDMGDASELYLREMEITAFGNAFTFNLLDSYYYSTTPTAEEAQALEAITDEIFDGGSATAYAYDLPVQGLTVYQFFIPCNGYEFILVK